MASLVQYCKNAFSALFPSVKDLEKKMDEKDAIFAQTKICLDTCQQYYGQISTETPVSIDGVVVQVCPDNGTILSDMFFRTFVWAHLPSGKVVGFLETGAGSTAKELYWLDSHYVGTATQEEIDTAQVAVKKFLYEFRKSQGKPFIYYSFDTFGGVSEVC